MGSQVTQLELQFIKDSKNFWNSDMPEKLIMQDNMQAVLDYARFDIAFLLRFVLNDLGGKRGTQEGPD